MKKYFLLVIILISNTLFIRENRANDKQALSSFKLGFYGGINFNDLSKIGSTVFIEAKTNLTSNLNIKLSIGYERTYMPVSYHVNTYSIRSLPDTTFFEAISYNVYKKGFDIIPFTLGIQYIIKYTILSPYLLSEFSINSFDTKVYRTPATIFSFNSFNELPDEYKIKHEEVLVTTSFKIGLGIGAIYPITSKLNLDVRYLFQFDNRIINTHQVILGISF